MEIVICIWIHTFTPGIIVSLSPIGGEVTTSAVSVGGEVTTSTVTASEVSVGGEVKTSALSVGGEVTTSAVLVVTGTASLGKIVLCNVEMAESIIKIQIHQQKTLRRSAYSGN